MLKLLDIVGDGEVVLDLDHTRLNCLHVHGDGRRAGGEFAQVQARSREGLTGPEGRTLHFVERLQIWTKLRPGVKKFLRQVASMFEVHVITMGTQSYADEMRQLIDPGRQHIKGSVIGLGQMDEFGELQPADTKRLDGVSSPALIPSPWCSMITSECGRITRKTSSRSIGSLLPVGAEAVRGLAARGVLLEKKVDEIADRSTLAAAFEVLRRVHQDFFAERAGHLALGNKKAKDAGDGGARPGFGFGVRRRGQ